MATDRAGSLEHDQEYIALLARHLDKEQKLKWINEEENCVRFYSFLEKLAKQARKVQGIHDTLKAIGQQTDPKANICGKTHGGTCYK